MYRKPTTVYAALIWLCIILMDTLTGCSESGPFAGTLPTFAPADTTPPVMEGIKDHLVYQGTELAFLEGVTLTDDEDEDPTIEVDASKLDLTQPGVYTVRYLARDAAGNTALAASTVTVLEKKEGYVSFEEIYTLLDATVSSVVTDEMDTRQQVEAIYNWMRNKYVYSGHSDKSDPYQAAYRMMTEHAGDCYSYFALCKLMFDRLGIPNLDVVKVKNSENDSQHFWSLVSVDGGKNFYHFDSTPRVGGGDDFCLVTDAFLDAYSANHKNCHNRDTSLYPHTPEV